MLWLCLFSTRGAACEHGCPSLIRAASQPGRRKRFFSDRQVARMINIPAALGCRGFLAGAFSSLPLKRDRLSSVVLVAREKLCREAWAGAGSPPSLLPPPSPGRV